MSGRERFLDAAVEPLVDNAEMQIAARHRLELELCPEVDEGELEAATQRLRRPGRSRWKWFWVGLVMLVSLPMWFGPVKHGVRVWQDSQTHLSLIGGFDEPSLEFREKFSASDRLLLFGDEGADEVEIWLGLWESDPENPMYYFEYALSYEWWHDELPSDFLETTEELDPENGWPLMRLAVEGDLDFVVDRNRMSTAARKRGDPTTWTIHDEAEFAKRIDLLKRMVDYPKLTSYQGELMAARFAVIPQATDLVEYIQTLDYLAGLRIDVPAHHLRDLIGAEARRCEHEGDVEGFGELARVWEKLTPAAIDQSGTLVEGLIARVFIEGTLPTMELAAAALDVDPELWARRAERARSRKEQLDDRPDVPNEELVFHHGSLLSSLSLPTISRMVVDTPQLTKEDLRPMTRVDQAFLAKGMAGAGWVILGLFAGVSLIAATSRSVLSKCLGRCLSRWWKTRDYVWVGAFGLILPLLIFLGLRYLTPLSRLDWGPSQTFYAVPISHFVGLLLMLVVWPVAIAGLRASVAGRIFGWKRSRWWAGSAMLAPILGMLCFSFALPPGSHSMPIAMAGIAFGAWSLVWLLVQCGLSAFGKPANQLRRHLVGDLVRPVWLVSLLLMVLLSFHFHAEERRWLTQDRIMCITPGYSVYEATVTEVLKDELREIVE